MTQQNPLPKHDDLFTATLTALQTLGGSASNEEINEAVATAVGATQTQLDVTHAKSGAPVLYYRMSWARSYLKAVGLLANPKLGVWVLTEEGRTAANKPNGELKKWVAAEYKAVQAAKKAAQSESSAEVEPAAAPDGELGWNGLLLQRLQVMEAAAFERLCQRVLRESGFIRVEVSGKSGDGGIDGAGVLRMNLISFQVLFQAKRWKGSVGSEVVRNFRGAMQGRADKGLIITTSTFTGEARKEATRDGAPAIDLIDGEALCTLLKDLRIGVHVTTRTVEDVTVDEQFLQSI